MRQSLTIPTLCSVALLIVLLPSCAPTPQPGQLQVSFPLSTQQVLPDTTIRKNIKEVGTLVVTVKNGRMDIENKEKLPPTIGWAIYSSRVNKEGTRQSRSEKNSSQRTRTFMFASNTLTVDGPPVMQTQGGEEEDGLPHIRWIEVATFGEGSDTTGVYVGVPTTNK